MIDWPAWAFVALIAIGCMVLWRESTSPESTFRVIQFVTGPDGRGNSGSLAYVVALLVSTWYVWYEAVNGRGSGELILIYTGVFVTGGVVRQGITAWKEPAHHRETTTTISTTTGGSASTPQQVEIVNPEPVSVVAKRD